MRHESMTVLHVEDNAAHAELVRRSFEEHFRSYNLVLARDGQEALEMLFGEEGSDPLSPCLILLDLRLPRTSGLEVLRQVKESGRYATIPVVILTTSAAPEDVRKAYEYGANSFLVKPLDFNEFATLVEDCGSYWLSWNQRVKDQGGL